MSARVQPWGRIIPATISAVLLPAILKILLRADLPWPLLAALALGNLFLFTVSMYTRGVYARAFSLLATIYTVALAAVALTGILISPYSAYGIWFEMVRDGEPRGLVSNVMVLLATVFSSALARRFLDSEFLLPFYGQLSIAAGMLALIYQTRLFYTLLLCLLALGSAVLSLRFVRSGNRLRNCAVFLLLFLSLLALARLPLLVAEPRGSRIVGDRLHPGLRKTVVVLLPRFPLLYGIPGFGYGYDTDRLGGAPILSEAPIFEIRGYPGQRLYLRTGTYSTYDGHSWIKSAMPGESSGRSEEPKTGGLSPFRVLDPVEVPPSSLRITILAEYYALLPFTLNTGAIFLPPERIEGISGNFDDGYRLEDPLRFEQSIYLRFGQTGREGGAPAEALSAAEKSEYLQLPGTLSSELLELAANLADPTGETRATLRNIERFLARNYTYNLDADRIPVRADFVDAFLFQSREGYCVHFASSFIVLARLNGIPARYTTGYLATLPGASYPFDEKTEPGRNIVTGLSAHAWPEVWLEDRGWTTWEATTAVNPSYYEEIGGGWLYEYGREDNRLTNRQLRSVLGREPASRPRAAGRLWSLNRRILFLLIPIPAVLLLIMQAIRRFGILLLAALYPDRSSATKIVAKIATGFHRRGVDRPDTLGWVKWTGGIGKALNLDPRLRTRFQSRSRRLLSVIQRLMYSDQSFRKLDLRFLRAFYLKHLA